MQRGKRTMSFHFGQAEKEQSQVSVEARGDTEDHKETAPAVPKILTWDAAPFANERSSGEQASEDDDFIPEPSMTTHDDKVIDFTQKQEEKREGEAPFWDDGNRVNPPKLPPKGRKRVIKDVIGVVPWNLVTAIVSAIVVGLGLGFVVYKMVVTESIGTASEGGENLDAALAAAVEAGLPTWHVDVVQGAAFDTVEQGQPVVDKVKQGGLPATLFSKSGESSFLFVGVAPDKAGARSLSAMIEEKGQDTYVKTYTIEGGRSNTLDTEAITWFLQAHGLYKELLQETSRRLVDEEGASVQADDVIKKMEGTLKDLTAARDRSLSKLPEKASEQALNMHNGLVKGLHAFASFESGQEKQAMWQAQQSLLDALYAYASMVEVLAEA
ncbi:hypothetical protein NSQ26_09130 [Bacillus sp. FSL W7-1360]